MKPSESHIHTILKTLKERYPVVQTQLEHDTPFQLLVATIMSAQCTDKQVNQVTRRLFKAYPDADSLAAAPLAAVKKMIFSTRFYNNKARNIKACARIIAEEFNGAAPDNMAQLVKLPGVGRKTANVVLSVAFGYQTIVVDTHVLRTSQRLGLTSRRDPVKVEQDLMAVIPEDMWNDLSLQLIYFGREICDAKRPGCDRCPLFDICKTKGRL